MLKALGAAIVAAGLLASPAMAQRAFDWRMTPAYSLQSVGLDPHAPGIAAKLTLRLGAVASPIVAADPLTDHVRPKFAVAMVDYFPIQRSGFHLSGGARLYARRNFMAEMDNATRGLLYAPRGSGGGMRTGYRKFSPALMAGYTGDLSPTTSVGFEMGERMGRAFQGSVHRLVDGLRAVHGDPNGESGFHPVANLVFQTRF